MRLRTLMTTGSVAVALLECFQFAGPRPTRRVETPFEFNESHRPIVAVLADGLSVQTYYTPTSNRVDHPMHGIVERLKEAKESVRVQAYGFTSKEIADQLIAAHKRGLDVKILLDRSNLTDRHTMAWACQGAGIPVLFDHGHAIAHNKVMVIDGKFTFTGSYNYTDSAAYHNAENAVMIASPKIAEQFLENWELHAKEKGTVPGVQNPP